MIVILIGVSGSGKTTVGQALARTLHWPFLEGDDFHPAANRDKMNQGQPLDDADRRPWLEAIRQAMLDHLARDTSAVVACSALKRQYRQHLKQNDPRIHFITLTPPGITPAPGSGPEGNPESTPGSGPGSTPGSIHKDGPSGDRESTQHAAMLRDRLARRQGHFFNPALLDSQLEAWEPPTADDDEMTLCLDPARPVDELVQTILHTLGLTPA